MKLETASIIFSIFHTLDAAAAKNQAKSDNSNWTLKQHTLVFCVCMHLLLVFGGLMTTETGGVDMDSEMLLRVKGMEVERRPDGGLMSITIRMDGGVE